MEFNVGDRVVAVTDIDGKIHEGDTGTVTKIRPGVRSQRVGVYWDHWMGGHTVNDTCPPGHGWWVAANTIDLDCDQADGCDINISGLI